MLRPSVIMVFNISSLSPLYYFSHRHADKVLSPVFSLLVKTIKYSENMSRALRPAIAGIANNPHAASRSKRRRMHISAVLSQEDEARNERPEGSLRQDLK